MRQPSAAQEVDPRCCDTLCLPFDGMPDFSLATSMSGYRILLQQRYPDMPPESLKGMLERSWGKFSQIHKEDIVAVILPQRKEVALAVVEGDYRYSVDKHQMSVRWVEASISFRAFHKHREWLSVTALEEITDAQTRIMIRDRLPYGYNRFAKWKWIIGVVIALKMIGWLLYSIKQ